MTRTTLTALAVILMAGVAHAAPKKADTPADTIHPNIHGKVGQGDGTNANPNGANDGGGNIHGIANVPGKNGDGPNDDGARGQANELETTHGGIGAYNRNAD